MRRTAAVFLTAAVSALACSGEPGVREVDGGECPIAGCLQAHAALVSACPTDTVACIVRSEDEAATICYENGVRVDRDYSGELQYTTVFDAGGRLCYSVTARRTADGIVFTVEDAVQRVVITEYYRAGLDSVFACPDGKTVVTNPTTPCGQKFSYPSYSSCSKGFCIRP